MVVHLEEVLAENLEVVVEGNHGEEVLGHGEEGPGLVGLVGLVGLRVAVGRGGL